ncbi:hypothetical protein ElyMa_005100200 [Elysia marginata]|uniref:Uncharacterized protein n=1 Tax=Elysia marginata TaxID=1093978 RepID=A0AAV4JHC3_9GAST|nr:hypothetical protein ElyMa_005100200 [Elysia marginata]
MDRRTLFQVTLPCSKIYSQSRLNSQHVVGCLYDTQGQTAYTEFLETGSCHSTDMTLFVNTGRGKSSSRHQKQRHPLVERGRNLRYQHDMKVLIQYFSLTASVGTRATSGTVQDE